MSPGAQHHAKRGLHGDGHQDPLPPLVWNHPSVRAVRLCTSRVSSPCPRCQRTPPPGPLRTSCQGTPVPRTSPGSSGQYQFGLRPECRARSTPIQSCLVRLSPPRSCPTSRGNWLLPLGTSAPAPGSVPSRAGPADHGCVHICVTAKRRGRRSPLPGAGRACCLTSCTLAHAPDTLARIYWAPTRCLARSQTHAFTEPPACPEGPTNDTTTPTAAKADGYRGGGGGWGGC